MNQHFMLMTKGWSAGSMTVKLPSHMQRGKVSWWWLQIMCLSSLVSSAVLTSELIFMWLLHICNSHGSMGKQKILGPSGALRYYYKRARWGQYYLEVDIYLSYTIHCCSFPVLAADEKNGSTLRFLCCDHDIMGDITHMWSGWVWMLHILLEGIPRIGQSYLTAVNSDMSSNVMNIVAFFLTIWIGS